MTAPGGMATPQVFGAPGQESMDAQADIFNGNAKLFIQQEMAAIEICGIEAKQRYRISDMVLSGDKQTEGNVFLYITEESNCLMRICFGPNRALTLKVHGGPSKEAPVIQTMKKPFACQGPCPCCRPSFEVFAGPMGSTSKVGKIEDPCRCCTMDQQVFNASESKIFTTSGSSCQLGMCCQCCDSVRFEMKNPSGERAGGVEKLPMDCAELFLKTNRFVVDMTGFKEPGDRRMALASAMLLDLSYFEQSK